MNFDINSITLGLVPDYPPQGTRWQGKDKPNGIYHSKWDLTLSHTNSPSVCELDAREDQRKEIELSVLSSHLT